jgi:osmotically-inducible protein OsmY
MISRTNGNRNWSLIRHTEEKCRILARDRADDNVDFRCDDAADDAGDLVSTSFARDVINESRKDELTVGKKLVDEGDLVADDIIVDMVHQALCASGHRQLRNLQVRSVSGRITLSGRVATYHQKQLAQTVTRSVTGVRGIDNDVNVISPS